MVRIGALQTLQKPISQRFKCPNRYKNQYPNRGGGLIKRSAWGGNQIWGFNKEIGLRGKSDGGEDHGIWNFCPSEIKRFLYQICLKMKQESPRPDLPPTTPPIKSINPPPRAGFKSNKKVNVVRWSESGRSKRYKNHYPSDSKAQIVTKTNIPAEGVV